MTAQTVPDSIARAVAQVDAARDVLHEIIIGPEPLKARQAAVDVDESLERARWHLLNAGGAS